MFFDKNITITRKTAGGYNDDGVFVEGTSRTMTVLANVQPLNQRETEQYTQILPGGNRIAKLVKVYTNAILLTDVQTIGQTADSFEWLGRTYKIVMVEEWQSNIISHYRYIGQEVIANDNK